MKKSIMMMVASMVVVTASQADLRTAPYVGLIGGAGMRVGELVNQAVPVTAAKKTSLIGHLGAMGGYQWVRDTWLFDVYGLADYTMGTIKVTVSPTGQATIKLDAGLAGGVRFGRLFNATSAVFVGVSMKFNWMKAYDTLNTPAITSSIGLWTLVPEIGLRGTFTDNLEWYVAINYSATMSLTFPAAVVQDFAVDNKLQGFGVKAALIYSF